MRKSPRFSVNLRAEPIAIPAGQTFVLGNRNEQRSFKGVLYYAAIYKSALTPAEIAHNVAILQQSDDAER